MLVMKKKLLMIILIAAVAILIAAIISAIVCSREIKVSGYDVPVEGLENSIKALVISDLHGREYGENNGELVALIAQQKPDVIFVDVDMISRDASEKDIQRLEKLLKDLLKIAPMFYSTGNHEIDYMEEHGEMLLDRISATGAVVLYDSYVETEIAGNTVRIGGTSGHYRDISWEKQLDYAMQEEIGSTDVPAIVLMHMPENMVKDSARERWNADLYISGHAHGGVVRLPLIGGIVAPTQGFFPEYDYGQYLVDERLNLIISSGLSGYDWIPRVFNKPEICVITMVSK